MRVLNRSMTDIVAGSATSLVGALVVYLAWGYPMGTARDMGPGYFPTIAGATLVLLGLGILFLERLASTDEAPEYVGARQLLLVLGGIAAFAGLVGPFGLLPATAASVFLSALADRTATLVFAIVLAVVVSLVCVGIFVYGLNLQIPAVRW